LRSRGIETRSYAIDATETSVRDGIVWEPIAAGEVGIVARRTTVVDSYHVGVEAFDEQTDVVALVDDGRTPARARLAVQPATAASNDPRVLSGLGFACLRPAFWGLPPRENPLEVRSVLLTTGATDLGGVASRLAAAVRAAVDGELIAVVGPHASGNVAGVDRVLAAPATLLDALLEADLVVTAGGQTLFEAAATGVPIVAVPVVENQRRQVETLSALGGAVASGAEDLEDAVRSLAQDAAARSEMGTRAQQLIDGYGALRVAFAIDRLAR
jgi:spore coat polysaccharide biosynthesis predicted glycosyltransferase SpsG